MKFTNTAIVYDELLMDIVSVLEYGWPAGPTFFHSLGSLIEAAVIHETVFFDPINYFGRPDLSGDDITSKLLASEFIQELLKEKALVPFPNWNDVEPYLASIGNDYQAGEFLADNTMGFIHVSLSRSLIEKKMKWKSISKILVCSQMSSVGDTLSKAEAMNQAGRPSSSARFVLYHFTVYDALT